MNYHPKNKFSIANFDAILIYVILLIMASACKFNSPNPTKKLAVYQKNTTIKQFDLESYKEIKDGAIAQDASSPNIVFILADDLGWMDVAFNGSEFYETPNLDRLVKESAVFKRAYTTAPVCSPVRGSIMSGKYPVHTRFTGLTGQHGKPSKGKMIDADFIPGLPSNELSIAEMLKSKNYTSWHLGKWHLGEGETYSAKEQGFDVSMTGFENAVWKNQRFRKLDDKFITDHLTDEAIKLIAESKNQPFYLNLWYYAVHVPIAGKQKDIDYFKNKAKIMGLDTLEAFNTTDNYPSTPWFVKTARTNQKIKKRILQSNPDYAAFIYNMDRNIGRIINKLDELGIADNTLLIFFSDNGGLSSSEGSPTSNAPLREGKGWMYDGAYRVPMVMRYPKIMKSSKQIDELVSSVDFLPTIADVADIIIEKKHNIDGKSLLPLMRGEDKLDREAIYWHSPHYFNQGGHPFSAVLSEDYKYMYSYHTEKGELFKLTDDISEEKNLIKTNPAQAEKMNAMLQKWLMKNKALYPTKNPDFIIENSQE